MTFTNKIGRRARASAALAAVIGGAVAAAQRATVRFLPLDRRWVWTFAEARL
jgi:hypothetical protein